MTQVKRWMLAGLVMLGAAGASCEDQGTGAPAAPPGAEVGTRLGAEIETEAPAGTTVDPGASAQMGEVQKLESERRALYEDVAGDVGVEPWPGEQREQAPGSEAAVGGGGAAGADERRGCGATIEEDANAQVVSGTLRRTSREALTLETQGGQEVRLHTDSSTCVLLAGRPIPPESLSEGTQVRASYVIEDGQPTARMVRTQPADRGR